ncbi:MAG: hypothetical protein QG622_1285 [Actinomycetota bacterium]|nr:hypothetical protein [Actinomycetota bacterium]
MFTSVPSSSITFSPNPDRLRTGPLQDIALSDRFGKTTPNTTDPRTDHQTSHLHLLSTVPSYAPGTATPRLPLSAVIVPTRRSGDTSTDGLGLAVRCAEAHNAQLVVLRSGPAAQQPFPRALAPSTSAPTLVVDLPESFSLAFADPSADRHPVRSLYRAGDLGAKRNLGLILGLLCDWQTVLFLDDDIGTTRYWRPTSEAACEVHPLLRLDDVLADLATYPDLQAVGYLSQDFRDNSVVCHARRLLGLPQDLFIGGGATIIRCGPQLPFFPEAYNEDWLFYFSLMLDGRHHLPSSAVKVAGSVFQRPYYPFSPTRARSEELGDVLAEGLFALMTRPRTEILALSSSSTYWKDVVRQRQNMVLDLLHRASTDCGNSPVHDDARVSLLAALSAYDQGSIPEFAAELASYVRGFLHDTDSWNDLLSGLTPRTEDDVLDLPEALALTGLRAHGAWTTARTSRSRPTRATAALGFPRLEPSQVAS